MQFGSFCFDIRPRDEKAFMILFARTILFLIAERIDFSCLCDFMGLSLDMPFSEAL
jgi:hypothetical protein